MAMWRVIPVAAFVFCSRMLVGQASSQQEYLSDLKDDTRPVTRSASSPPAKPASLPLRTGPGCGPGVDSVPTGKPCLSTASPSAKKGSPDVRAGSRSTPPTSAETDVTRSTSSPPSKSAGLPLRSSPGCGIGADGVPTGEACPGGAKPTTSQRRTPDLTPGNRSTPPVPAKTAELLLRPDAACSLSVDGAPLGDLKARVIKLVSIDFGEHLIQATTKDGSPWEKVVDIQSPHQKVLLIDVGRRQKEAKGLQQEILSNNETASRLETERKKVADQQAELKRKQDLEQKAKLAAQEEKAAKRKDILTRKEPLQRQAREENYLAMKDEQLAASFTPCASTIPGCGLINSAGQLLQQARRQSAQAHRDKAQELQSQVDDLQNELMHLDIMQ